MRQLIAGCGFMLSSLVIAAWSLPLENSAIQRHNPLILKPPIILAYYTNWSSDPKSRPFSAHRPYPVPGSRKFQDGHWVTVKNADFLKQVEYIDILAYSFMQIYHNQVKKSKIKNKERGKIYFTDTKLDLYLSDAKPGGICAYKKNHTLCYTAAENNHPKVTLLNSKNFGSGNFSAFSKLPHVKRIIVVGGPNDTQGFEQGAFYHDRNMDGRENFVNSVVYLIDQFHLDGIDLDYEPAKGYNPNSAAKLVDLTKRLRIAFNNKHWDNKLITVDILADNQQLTAFNGSQQNLAKLATEANYINIMAYDFHGTYPGETTTNFHSNLYIDTKNPEHHDYSAHKVVKQLVLLGVPARKLILGIPSYGHVEKHVTSYHHGLYQPFFGRVYGDLNSPGDIDMGEESYFNIVNKWLNNPQYNFKQYEVTKDIGLGDRYQTIASWAYANQGSMAGRFVAYDSPAVIDTKAEYIKVHGLGGAAIWELSSDIPPGDPKNASIIFRLANSFRSVNP